MPRILFVCSLPNRNIDVEEFVITLEESWWRQLFVCVEAEQYAPKNEREPPNERTL
jgi:hypothetical protein